MDYEIYTAIEELKNLNIQLQQRIEYLENSSTNRHIEFVQSINMQIGVLNQVSQSTLNLNSKLSDIEIRSGYTDEALKELVDSNNNLVQELSDIKNSLDIIKMNTFGFNPNLG
ncbi:hypothetical protein D3C87_77490 [compost metagenome]